MARDVSDASSPTPRDVELLRHAADIIVEVGLDGRFLYVSDAVRTILAREPEAFIGRSFLEIIVPEDRAESLAHFQKILATGSDTVARFRVPREDGVRISFEATLRIFSDTSDGHSTKSPPRRIVGVARDITQQSIDADLANRRASFHHSLVESGLRPAAIVSPDGQIVFSNRLFKTTFGQSIQLEDIYSRMSSDDRQTIETAWFNSNRKDREGRGSGDFEYICDDGSSRWFATSWSAFQDEDERRLVSVLYEDISHRKRVEFALQSMAEDIASQGTTSVRANIERVAIALDLDRLVMGSIDPDRPEVLKVAHAWEDGAFSDLQHVEIKGLPDSAVAAGETCIYPAGVGLVIPGVTEKIGPQVESYAGAPLRDKVGRVIGLVGGYSRNPIADPQLTRSLISTLATHAAAATELERANKELRTNQDRLDVLATHTKELLVEADANGIVTYASTASLKLLGYKAGDLVGKRIVDFIHPQDRELTERSRHDLISGAERTFVVLRALHSDGTWRWIESSSTVITAPNGAKRSLTLSRDTTQRRQVELSRDLLYRVVQQGADLIFVCEHDATIIFANETATRQFESIQNEVADTSRRSSTGSVTRGDKTLPTREQEDGNPDPKTQAERQTSSDFGASSPIAGQKLYDILTSDTQDRLRDAILPDLTRSSLWSGELQLKPTDNGPPIPTEARVFLISAGESKDRTYLVVTLRDIGARRTAEEALRQSEFRLNQAQKMEAVGRLAGGIAHDFNNLLTAIIGYSDLVLDEVGEGHVAHQDVEEILRAADRAGGLTRQLLAFSRRQVLQPESIDLNAIVADVDRMMRRLIGENINLVTQLAGELKSIIADPGQIEQVLVNLVVNARDAMPQGGRLEIETANLTTQVESSNERRRASSAPDATSASAFVTAVREWMRPREARSSSPFLRPRMLNRERGSA